ncbi:hypothetical protein [Govanella unica]|uniref:Uncharacterized protein n=1 Tax=Govanella unica TaxID=2975056 RepID=A0A9X3TW46_9PROT|nr:hypothetical protein [Govania unica]MDA5193026.1 hypothetical protein [Govania unica]
MALLLHEIIAAGALQSVVKNLFDGGAGVSVRDRAFDAVRTTLRDNLGRIVAVIVAICMMMTAVGFLIAAFFLWVVSQIGAPLGAAVTGGLLLVLGGSCLLYSTRSKPKSKGAETAAASEAASAKAGAGSSFMDVVGSILREFKDGAGKYSLFIYVILFLVGVWLGFKEKDAEQDSPPQD